MGFNFKLRQTKSIVILVSIVNEKASMLNIVKAPKAFIRFSQFFPLFNKTFPLHSFFFHMFIARLCTALALNVNGLAGQLPIIRRFFPDIFGRQFGELYPKLFINDFNAFLEQMREIRDGETRNYEFQKFVERICAVILRKCDDKVLYTKLTSTDIQAAGEISLVALFLMVWLAPILVFKCLKSQGQYASAIAPVRYEDFVRNTKQTWNEIILPFCGVRMRKHVRNQAQLPRAIHRDSHQGCFSNKAALQNHCDTLLQRDLDILDDVISAAGVAGSVNEFIEKCNL